MLKMKENPIEPILDELDFSPVEKDAMMKIIKYARICQETGEDTLKGFIDQKIEEVINNENK